jgi:predicted GNAT family acetyltransferase
LARPIALAESRHPLDHPIWNALASVQSTVAEGDDRARRYPAAMAPFAATRDTSQESYAALRPLVSGNDRVALFTSYAIDPPKGFTIELATTAEQMVAPTSISDVVRASVVELGERDVSAMRDLVELTKPGPLGPRTHELGRFLGVWDDRQLVAMAGERMKMPGYTEITVVCTHPSRRGQGPGEDVVNAVSRRIRARGNIPFLHVFSNNAPAIALYRRLGFTLRCQLQLTIMSPNDN